MQYRFILKDNNQKAYRSFVWFLFFLHIVAAGTIGLNTADKDVKFSVYFLLGMYVVINIIYFFIKKRKRALYTYSFIMAMLYVNFWLRYAGFAAAGIFILLFLFITVVQQKKTTVLLSDDGVHLKRIFKTIIYPWPEMDNVILKDNLLTIDFKINKLIQAEIAEGSDAVDEKNFNLFCIEQLQNNS